MKLEAFDSSCFLGKSHLEDDGMQNFFSFSQFVDISKNIANSDQILVWKLKRLKSDKNTKPPAVSNNSLAPVLNYINTKLQVKVDGSCLKQDKLAFNDKKVVNLYIVCEIKLWSFNVGKDSSLGEFWFGPFGLIKNVDHDQYRYSGYGIGFNACGKFSLSDGSGIGKNVIIS